MSKLGAQLVRGYCAVRPRAEGEPKLEPLLLSAWEGARAQFPSVKVEPPAFAAHLARHAEPSRLEKLRCAELLLCCGCLEGDRSALEHFERLLSEAHRALLRMDGGSALTEDVLDQVRHHALAGKGGEPLLATFAGRGPLAGWLQAAAVRTALNVRRKAKREVPLDDAPLAERASADDPELELLKGRDRAHFQKAFTEALGALSPRERTLLRLRFLDGLTIEQIAAAQQVHRTTVIRWLGQAHQALLEDTRRRLRDRLRAGNATLESLLQGFDGQLDVSLGQALKTRGR